MLPPIERRIREPRREGLSTEELWFSDDDGLIASWEAGRRMVDERPEIADAARRGELPILPFKGGVEKALKISKKYGPFRYLAMWQGLRGDDLEIDRSENTAVTCSRTGVMVIFTQDRTKYAGA